MQSLDKRLIALSRKYTDETVIGGGAIKGKNCTIKKIEQDGLDNIVTFEWTLDDGTIKTDTMRVPGGETGVSVVSVRAVPNEPAIIFVFSDGTESQKILIPTVKGDPGFSPVIEVEEDTDESYKLRITTEVEEIVTPNLKGNSGDYDGLLHQPSINSVKLSGDKSLDDLGIQEITQSALAEMWES